MATQGTLCAKWTRLRNRIAARRAAWTRQQPAFVAPPEPRAVGCFARGQQLSQGYFRFAGHGIEQPERAIWDITPPSAEFAAETHGFGWLDDLAAAGDGKARMCAQEWTWQWIARFGTGFNTAHGPGWTPNLTGRRLFYWLGHAEFLLAGQNDAARARFQRSLGQQTLFLGRRWHASPPGMPRLEALSGLLHASLTLKGMEDYTSPAASALADACDAHIGETGTLASRNPEELLDVFSLLTWAIAALSEAGLPPAPRLVAAVQRIAPTLRSLRHADGGLARFHDGDCGLEGRLDAALAASGVKPRQPEGLAMGYARLSAGRTSIVIDAAPPPTGAASTASHASAMAFELTSGRRPIIVNCGSGACFSADWRRAGRATAAHSTLVVAGESSAQIDTAGTECLKDGPGEMPFLLSRALDGVRFEGGHDGYAARFGLTHARTIEMTFEGRGVAGEDKLLALTPEARRRFDKAMIAGAMQGVPYQIHFHLHPEVDAELDMGGSSVSLALRSGEIWLFRTDARAAITLEPSIYLEKAQIKPRATKQIVLSGRVLEYAGRIRWSLAKAQESPIGLRDLAQNAPVWPHEQ